MFNYKHISQREMTNLRLFHLRLHTSIVHGPSNFIILIGFVSTAVLPRLQTQSVFELLFTAVAF